MCAQRLVRSLALVMLVGCGGSTVGGNTGGGGSPTSTGGTTGSGGTPAPAGSGGTAAAGSGGAGGTTGQAGNGGPGAAGTSGGGPGGGAGAGGPAGSGGSGGSGTAGSAGGAGGAPAPSAEDSGANCTVAAVPALLSPGNAQLPDPFTKFDGTRMSTKAEWRCRREEILKMAQQYALGTKPAKPTTVTGSVSRTSVTVMATANGKSASFTATVALPTGGQAPYPAIIVYASPGFGAPLDSATINSEGVALITYNPYDVGAEGHGHGANQSGAFYSIYSGGSAATGLLAAWGWGVSRIVDVIAQSDGSILQAGAIGVAGCSRFGKGAFIAGVLDERIALTMPIESGTDGVPIWRGIARQEKGANGNPPQSLPGAYGEQPWYADASNMWTNDPTRPPLDTHELVAAVAPRGLFIMENPFIGELASKYGHVAALGGIEVYAALGAGDAVSYYSDVASGTHCSNRPEWTAPLKNNIERFLKKTGTAAGMMKPAASQTGDLSTWRTWTRPTLN